MKLISIAVALAGFTSIRAAPSADKPSVQVRVEKGITITSLETKATVPEKAYMNTVPLVGPDMLNLGWALSEAEVKWQTVGFTASLADGAYSGSCVLGATGTDWAKFGPVTQITLSAARLAEGLSYVHVGVVAMSCFAKKQ